MFNTVIENKAFSILLLCWFSNYVEHSQNGEDTAHSIENQRNFAHLSNSVLPQIHKVLALLRAYTCSRFVSKSYVKNNNHVWLQGRKIIGKIQVCNADSLPCSKAKSVLVQCSNIK